MAADLFQVMFFNPANGHQRDGDLFNGKIKVTKADRGQTSFFVAVGKSGPTPI